MDNKSKHDPAQKYCMVYADNSGQINHEVFDKKVALKHKLREVNRQDIKYIFKGRIVPVKVEERLTV